MNTYKQAVAKAKKLAKKHNREFFVIFDSGDYDIADERDLVTWYDGIHDWNILFSTEEVYQ